MISFMVVAKLDKRRDIFFIYFIIYIYIYIYMYIYDWCIFMCYLFSSPYLLVFGDDRVCGTREQMILQEELVRLRLGAWARLGVLMICIYKLWNIGLFIV